MKLSRQEYFSGKVYNYGFNLFNTMFIKPSYKKIGMYIQVHNNTYILSQILQIITTIIYKKYKGLLLFFLIQCVIL